MSGGYNPKVSHPYLSNNIPQMRSNDRQTPFFFGGSQVPIDLELPVGSFSGSGMSHFKKGMPSKTHKGEEDFTTKKGDIVFHQKGHYIRKPILPYQIRK